MEQESKSLISIANEIAEFNRKMVETGGELTPELESQFDLTGANLAQKIDAYAYMIENCDVQSVYFKGRADVMTAGRRVFESIKDRLKDRLKMAMRDMDTRDLLGVDFRFKGSELKPKLVIDEAEVPAEYFMEETTVQKILDKERIEADLMLGKKIPGAHLEQVIAVRQYANTSNATKKIKGKKNDD